MSNIRHLLALASKSSSGTSPLLRRGATCWKFGDMELFSRAAASVAASTPFDIGKALSISAVSPLSVQVKHRSTGDMHTEIRVSEASGANASERFTLEAGEHGIRATELAATQEPAELVATIPERYCGVAVQSQGGSITLPGVTETYLDVGTVGDGDVSVGKVKATSVAITTQSGSVTGSVTATDIKIQSSGGNVTLKRVAGKTAQLATGGGVMDMEVLQVAAGRLHSGGGNITIGQVTPFAGDLSEHETAAGALAVQLHSAGGDVSILGLDGSLSIDSAGGDVVLQCTHNLRQATVRSQGGNVTVYVQPDMQVQMHAAGGKGVEVQQGCVVSGSFSQQTPTMVQGCLVVQGQSSSGQELAAETLTSSTRGERAEPRVEGSKSPGAKTPLLVVQAGGGGVNLWARSWRDSMLQKMALKRAVA